MRSAAVKDILREIWRTRNRFLSIFAIVALGAGFFSGLKAVCPDMLATGDEYFAGQNLLDIRLVSTYGFNENDMEAIRGVAGIRSILPSYSKDVFVKNDGNANILAKVMALPDDTLPDYADGSVNQAVLLEGRLPESADECVIERNAQMPVDLEIGAVVSVYTGDPDDPVEDSLARSSWTVVGVVRSPRYISFERGSTDIGNGNLNTYIMVNAENFTMDVFTEVSVTLEDTADISAFSDAYEDTVERYEDTFEALADTRKSATARFSRRPATRLPMPSGSWRAESSRPTRTSATRGSSSMTQNGSFVTRGRSWMTAGSNIMTARRSLPMQKRNLPIRSPTPRRSSPTGRRRSTTAGTNTTTA
ncbi:MAG TPA: hypothetical protein PLU82_00685 [Oscillospiraceae bacterium]|nr:hypothetical protein [Oscillospiraceae bacterium]